MREQYSNLKPARAHRVLRFLCLTAVLLFAGLPGISQGKAAQAPLPSPAAAPTIDISKLTAAERSDLLSRLSDEQVRELMMTYMKEAAGAEAETPPMMDSIHLGLTQFRARLSQRLSHFGDLLGAPAIVYDRLASERGAYHPVLVLVFFGIIALLGLAAERGYRYVARRLYAGFDPKEEIGPMQRLCQVSGRLLLDLVGVTVFAAGVLALFFLLYEGHEPTRLTVMTLLVAIVIVRLASTLSRFFFAPRSRFLRIAPFDDRDALRVHRWIVALTALTAFGILLCALFLRLGIPVAQHDLLLNLIGTVVVAALITGIFSLRKAVAASLITQIDGEDTVGRFLIGLASLWHIFLTAYVVVIYFMSLYTGLMDGGATANPGLISLLIVLLCPAVDFVLRTLLDYFLPGTADDTRARERYSLPVFKRAARILLVIVALFLIGRVWGVDFFTLGKQGLSDELMRAVVDISLTLLAAYVAWGVIKAALARYLPEEDDEKAGGDEGGASSAGRLETVMPLILRFIQVTLAVIVVMIGLSSLGVDIAPLLAGAGVIGLAVGFGAQSLVRDIVSGLFFLMDDAFRKGEYVDIGSVKGSVEGINVRSLVMRHHLGPLHTVPYGEIHHLTNYSRDWVIMKLEFRVPTDTDINKVKKIFKQIGAEMLEHPELGDGFIEPFKSQGVKAIEDSAIIVRGKFMAKPGRQFVIRKEIYNLVQKRFQENGVAFAHRKVTVDFPHDVELSDDQKERVARAAGAAAIAAEEADLESSPAGAKP